ncbi:hypothetical protein V6N13_133934 [Hibiscus sabdariffa]
MWNEIQQTSKAEVVSYKGNTKSSNVELLDPQILIEEACRELILANPPLACVVPIVVHNGIEMQLKVNEPTESVLDTLEHGVIRKVREVKDIVLVAWILLSS